MFTVVVVPLLVLTLGVGTYAIATMRPGRAWLLAGSGWLCYVVYEALMQARILCSGECNIRVDLLLIWPALLLATVAAAASSIWNRRRSR